MESNVSSGRIDIVVHRVKHCVTLWLGLVLCLAILSCKNRATDLQVITGQTMGTTFTVKYVDDKKIKPQLISQLLEEINSEVSTYLEESIISKVNKAKVGEDIMLGYHFTMNYLTAESIYKITDGAFNPTVMPLVNYYGFGFEKIDLRRIDTAKVRELRKLTDISCFELKLPPTMIQKKCNGAQLDFSAIAKGYAVDQIALQLEEYGVENYLVEIGGETYAKGKNSRGKTWTVGIRRPEPGNRRGVIKSFKLDGKAMATSGNYENFRQLEDGSTIAHTINPETGFPQQLEEEVLSSTVFASDCATADAYATAFKVMGLEKSMQLVEKLNHIEAFLVYADESGVLKWKVSSGLDLE